MVALVAIPVFIIAAWLTRRFCDPSSRLHILDHPNERSLHARPTPRSGGVAIVVVVFAGGLGLVILFGAAPTLLWLAAALILVAIVSYLDDRRGMAVPDRLLAHMLAAGLVLWGGFYVPALELPGLVWVWPVAVGVAATLLFVVWMINLYNFMDGMDGFAGGMAVIGFGALGWLGMRAGDPLFASVSLIVVAASAGFLVFNFPPARIFMGDVGSSALGLLAASLSLWGARAGHFPLWVGLLIFSPFIVDASVTLVRRAIRGEKVWQAHRSHYYQRLVQLGWGHRRTVLWEYGLMLGCVGSAVWVVGQSVAVQRAVLVAWVVAYAVLALVVQRLEARHHDSGLSAP